MVPGSVTADASSSANDATDGAMVPPLGRANGACDNGRSRQPTYVWLPVRASARVPPRPASVSSTSASVSLLPARTRATVRAESARPLARVPRLDLLQQSRMFGIEPQRDQDLLRHDASMHVYTRMSIDMLQRSGESVALER